MLTWKHRDKELLVLPQPPPRCDVKQLSVTDALTKQISVACVNGQVAEGSGHGAHHAVVAVGQQLRHHGETLLLAQ